MVIPDSVQAVLAVPHRSSPAGRKATPANGVSHRSRGVPPPPPRHRRTARGGPPTEPPGPPAPRVPVQTRAVPEPVYTFKHALTQEVAYQSLLLSTRRRCTNASHGHWRSNFQRSSSPSPNEWPLTMPRRTDHAQAVPYWQRAGQRAIERSANLEAIGHLTRGLNVLKTLPDTPGRPQQNWPC